MSVGRHNTEEEEEEEDFIDCDPPGATCRRPNSRHELDESAIAGNVGRDLAYAASRLAALLSPD